jgi:AcrR family transcriptional regulator
MELRERILESAKKLFSENGFIKVNTRTIAQEAGTSESGVFRTFNSKYEILMAIYDQSWGKVNEYIEQKVTKPDSDPRKQLISIIQALWDFYQEDKFTVSFIIMNTGNTDTLLIEKKESAIITNENIKYVTRIENLCREIVKRKLCSKALKVRALTEGILGISEGILLGWYLSDKTQGVDNSYPDKVSKREATEILKVLLYSNT